ncbi:MAG: FtsX-like permease family protein [Gammaproteobacteria bacterium]|nr:FtsX-like permease family protein [Gammaproteobacteria bacterium]
MIRHVFTLMWQRKGANALIIVELLVTFLILFALTGFSLNLYRLYNTPLGFNVANTWSVAISTNGTLQATDQSTLQQLLQVVDQMDAVEATELLSDRPFSFGESAMFAEVRGKQFRAAMNSASATLPEAIGMQLVEGRWFGPQDESPVAGDQNIAPILVNRTFSEAAGGDVVGLVIPNGPTSQRRIVGVFEDFRQDGEFYASKPLMMMRLQPESEFRAPPTLVLLVRPGATAQFEEQLQNVLQRTAPGWDFDVDSWTSLQQAHFQTFMIPLLIAAVVVLFLLVMVGFGMLGVLWQNVIRRTPEMGLRRALGASAGSVRLQVVLELLAVACLALVLGVALVVQLPLAGVIQAMDWNLFIPSVAVSTLVLLALCILFALYPSYQATRKDPVEALRYE